MKNFNKKQWAYFRLQNFWRNKRLAFGFLFALLVVLAVPVLVITYQIDVRDFVASLFGVGAIAKGIQFANMAFIGDISDDSDLNSQADQIAYEIALVEVPQIDTSVPFPQPNASREVGDITLKAGEVPHYFGSHNRPTYEGGGTLNDLTVEGDKNINIVLANAFRDKVLDFAEQKQGCKFILFFRKIETTQWFMIGSLDQPLRLREQKVQLNNEASVAPLTFGNKSLRHYYKYVGALTANDADVVAADATTIPVTDNDRYQLTTGGAAAATIDAVSDIAEADHGRFITIYGSGGAYPSIIADNATFTLAGGVSWTGNAGSKISFRILDNNTLVEVLGSRVQTA
ncbi:hypothetical protein [uncultured Draconibacterium sp.]|uniref:hypothetical protein n=1 Tax=uncultured Draconibacterium sp. TaxID=1573823 RepID=UPI0029C7B29B|nr:hypothetical protein [uncultured Draconibacterium sp.]